MKKVLGLLFQIVVWLSAYGQSSLPRGFVDAKVMIPNLEVELRYYSTHNFIGDTIKGYEGNRLILSKKAAIRLKAVQDELEQQGLGLKVFDAYRPQQAVNHFVEWARVLEDTLMKAEFYPNVKKQNLFKFGYIASKSGHSRGSTVDLTIIDLESKVELDMGSPFDYFGRPSWVAFEMLSKAQSDNRRLLQEVMISNGFKNYDKEWWHFTVSDEPFPDTYFNFIIKTP